MGNFFVIPAGTQAKLTKGDRTIITKLREQLVFDVCLAIKGGNSHFENDAGWIIAVTTKDVQEMGGSK